MTDDGANPTALVEAVRGVLSYARKGGIPGDLEAVLAGAVVDALLELADWRRGDMDPRRARSIGLAARMARARAAGVSIADLRERFGKSRSQVYRLLTVARQRATVPRETAGNT